MVIGPEIDETARKFRAIVGKEIFRRTTLPDEAVRCCRVTPDKPCIMLLKLDLAG
jgi:hypothetical protein